MRRSRVSLSRKGAKGRTRSRKLRSTSTDARTPSGRMGQRGADLRQQLETCRSELNEARGQLAEALDRETGTSEVLRVISSSRGELEPVFDRILTNATRICGANFGNMYLCDGD